MRTILGVLAAAAVLFLALYLIPRPSGPAGNLPVSGLPWQIETLPDGKTRVFGLVIGTDSLSDGIARFGSDGELAVVAAPGEVGSLELYFNEITAGAVTGKLILSAELPEPAIAALWQRAVKVEYMQSSTKKASPAESDVATAHAAVIRGITFIPSANLDEAIVLQRFGPPSERVRVTEDVEHFLYPERGLDLSLNRDGKEVLQYVAVSRFDLLRKPLLSPSSPTP
jgi:hypothetical protein